MRRSRWPLRGETKVTQKQLDKEKRDEARMKAGIAVRIARVRGDRSQRQFAREMNVFQQNVNRYESGTCPHTDFLIRVAVREDVDLNWLVLGKGTPPS